MQSTTFELALAFLAGMVLGAAYFGGLWLTVRNIRDRKHPLAVLFASFAVRAAVVVCAFWFVMNGRWERMGACLVGFLLVRQAMVFRARSAVSTRGGRTGLVGAGLVGAGLSESGSVESGSVESGSTGRQT